MAAGSPTRGSHAEGRPNPLTSERIVEAAKGIVERGGYEALSLRGLATSLDVTAPALYDHFASKDELLRSIAEQGYEQLRAGFEHCDGNRAIDRCRARAREYVVFAETHPELFRLMFMYRPAAILIPVDNELPEATRTFEVGTVDVARAVLDGDLVTRDVAQLNLTIWAAMHGVANVALMSPELAQQVVDDVIETVFRGLRP